MCAVGSRPDFAARDFDPPSTVATLLRLSSAPVNILLPVLVLSVPVLAITLLAVLGGKKLAGSCGAMNPDGKCSRCGVSADDAQRAAQAGRNCS